MPTAREDDSRRRAVVPQIAGRSLWRSAAWTGVGAAVVCATLSTVVVAICWLPVSGASGHSLSAARGGVLAFLAALHGGVAVDGAGTGFVPLGMTILVALVGWRAGAGLADAADALGEDDPGRLVRAGLTQIGSFTAVCLVGVPFARIGTSHASLAGVGLAAAVLFAASAGAALVRDSALADRVDERLPPVLVGAPRAAAAAIAVYVGMGALLVAGSLVAHHGRVEALSRQVGGGWSGVPILLLGVLAAPNAAIAGAAYLSGPGFAIGSGSTVRAFGATHGVLPDFPVLGAVPDGPGATTAAWWLMIATPVLAGLVVSRFADRQPGWGARLRAAVVAAALAGVGMAVLAWLGGGGLGPGRLHLLGASPWQVGGAVAAEVVVVACAGLVLAAAWRWLEPGELPSLRTLLAERDADEERAERAEAGSEQFGGLVVDEPVGVPAADQPEPVHRARPVPVEPPAARADPEGPDTLAG